ncbi:MAG: SMP-30/gluconolactonase/LRE family protein [Acidimicrobiales bacterium]
MSSRSGSRFVVSVFVALAMLVAGLPVGASSHVNVVSEGPRPSLEGVAVDKRGNVFVSSTFTGELLKFAPGSNEFEVLGTIDGWGTGGPGAGFLGLAVDAKGNVYGAAQWDGLTGVYRFDRKTGDETLIAGTEAMSFPNAITFDNVGNMYITDSNSTGLTNPLDPGDEPMGAIWRVDRQGNAMKWVESPLLGGDGGAGLDTPVGANGIAYRKGELTVANAEGFSLFTVPIERDGTAGEIEVLAGLLVTPDWPILEGPAFGVLPAVPDGIALDVHGGIYVASVAQNAVFRVNTDGTVDVLFYDPQGAVLNFPSSLSFGTGKGFKQTLYVANLAFAPTPPFAPASLVTIDVGVPGMPLP